MKTFEVEISKKKKKNLKNGLIFLLKLEADFFFEPMLSHKTFATNALIQNFLYDVWFGRDANCSKIQTSTINSNSSVDKLTLN